MAAVNGESGHEGGCLCGAIRYRFTCTIPESGYCHCRMCQRALGAPVSAWVTVAAGNFHWSSGTPCCYPSSDHAKRYFCGNCGSPMLFEDSDYPGLVDINVGTIDQPELFPPTQHIWTASRINWFDTDDKLPRHEQAGPSD